MNCVQSLLLGQMTVPISLPKRSSHTNSYSAPQAFSLFFLSFFGWLVGCLFGEEGVWVFLNAGMFHGDI